MDKQWVDKNSLKPDGYDKYRHCGCWPLEHIFEILEAVLATGNITSYNVLLVIPTIEFRADFDDFKDKITYKTTNFTIWSDFFDLKLPDCEWYEDEEGDRKEELYMATYKVLKFTHPTLVHSIDVYYKNK